jgi:hypothetical protein
MISTTRTILTGHHDIDDAQDPSKDISALQSLIASTYHSAYNRTLMLFLCNHLINNFHPRTTESNAAYGVLTGREYLDLIFLRVTDLLNFHSVVTVVYLNIPLSPKRVCCLCVEILLVEYEVMSDSDFVVFICSIGRVNGAET